MMLHVNSFTEPLASFASRAEFHFCTQLLNEPSRVMSHRTRWETPRGRYDEHNSKFSLSMKPKFNRPVGERNHF
jgi:hypothetical protein